MLDRIKEDEIKKWTPLYAKYNNGFLCLFLISVLMVLGILIFDWDRFIRIEALILINSIAYLPTIWWEIKTGYLSSPITIPMGLLSYKIKAVSRISSPLLFWALTITQTLLFLIISFASGLSLVQ